MTEDNNNIQPTGREGATAPEASDSRLYNVAGGGGHQAVGQGQDVSVTGNRLGDQPPSPGLPAKKRGRPRKDVILPPRVVDESRKPCKKRPACENLTDKYPLKKLVFYDDGKEHKGLGVFHDPEKGPSVVMMEILRDNRTGAEKITWPYRIVPKKGGGTPLLHHDMLTIRQSLIVPLANALLALAEEWFGGAKQIDAGRLAYQEEKKKDELGDKLKKIGGVF